MDDTTQAIRVSIMTIRRCSAILACAMFAAACISHAAPQAPATVEQRFAGRVFRADGGTASGAVIIVSDPVEGVQLATLRTGQDGRFTTDLPQAAYALTATDPDQFAYVPSVDGTRGPVEIRLDASCHRLEGRIVTSSRLPENPIVALGRLSELMGDRFGAAVASDGAFRACVPAATYFVYPIDGFAKRSAMVVVPYSDVLEYRTEARPSTDRVASDMSGITPESAEAFAAALPASTKVLGLGESNHGTREFYDERTALALNLATNQGIRLLMIEAGYGETLALDDYVNGAELDIKRAVQELGYWTWDTKTFLQTLAEIRAYNARLPAKRRIHVIGFDVQDSRGAVKYLQAQGTAVLSKDESAALDKLGVDRKAWTSFTPVERTRICKTLERIAATLGTGDANSTANRSALAARSLLLWFDALETTGPWQYNNVRDAGMARMVLDVLSVEPNARATLWAHLVHLGREFVIGQRSMGAHLAAALGNRYSVYGLFAAGGSARAWDTKLEIGVIARTLSAAPAYSLETVLAACSGGAPVTYWTFARAKGEAARWLDGVRALRSFGAVFLPEGRHFSYWNLRSFDGAILFDAITPTDPTPTGERRAKPKAK